MQFLQDKIFCFYFPQFYPTPENDFHWGEGFTDWDNVRSAMPLYSGHRQPRVPEGERYYNQSEPDVLSWQVSLAKKYGIDGFSFYHYWFDGTLTLEKPAENFLNDKTLDIEFCLTWANESWSKRWIGQDDVCIFKQTHRNDQDMWAKHYDYLVQFWSDPRYLKVDGKPVFIVYNPHLIKCAAEMFDYWNTRLQQAHGTTLHVVATRVSDYGPSLSASLYSSDMNFEPRFSYNSKRIKRKSVFASRLFQPLRYLPEPILNILTKLRYKLSSYEIVDYQETWDAIIADSKLKARNETAGALFFGAFVDWDNTPRYKRRAKIFKGANPKVFCDNFEQLVRATNPQGDAAVGDRLFFINAWNEWSEGAYLEPDSVYGLQYLEGLLDVKIRNFRCSR